MIARRALASKEMSEFPIILSFITHWISLELSLLSLLWRLLQKVFLVVLT